MKPANTEKLIRSYVSRLKGRFDPASVRAALELDLKRVFAEMLERGEIARVGSVSYRRMSKAAAAAPPAQNATYRIYRAIYVRGQFSAREIAGLTEADTSFIRRIIRQLSADGAIELVCRRKVPEAKQIENVFRVRHRDEFYQGYVLKKRSAKPITRRNGNSANPAGGGDSK